MAVASAPLRVEFSRRLRLLRALLAQRRADWARACGTLSSEELRQIMGLSKR